MAGGPDSLADILRLHLAHMQQDFDGFQAPRPVVDNIEIEPILKPINTLDVVHKQEGGESLWRLVLYNGVAAASTNIPRLFGGFASEALVLMGREAARFLLDLAISPVEELVGPLVQLRCYASEGRDALQCCLGCLLLLRRFIVTEAAEQPRVLNRV